MFICFICIFSLFSSACGGGGGSSPYSGLFFSDNQPDGRIDDNLAHFAAPPLNSTYTFLLFADLHFGQESETLLPYTQISDSIAAEANEGHSVSFVATLGDQTEAGKLNQYELYQAFITFIKSQTNNAPVYGVIGNHDLWNGGKTRWPVYVTPGTSFYHFADNSINRSFYFLDSASGTLGTQQLNNFEHALASDSRRKFVFMHYPLSFTSGNTYFMLADPAEKLKLYSLTDEYTIDMYFTGHNHEPSFYTNGTFAQYIAGSLRTDKDDIRYWTFVTVNEAAQTLTFKRYSLRTGETVPSTWIRTYNFIP